MRTILSLCFLAIAAGCESSSESFTINGEEVSREEFEEATGVRTGSATPPPMQDQLQDSSTGNTIFDDLADSVASVEEANLLALSNTAFSAIPSNSTATFEGFIVARASTPISSTTTAAETTMVVDFDSGLLTAENGPFVLFDDQLNPQSTLDGDLTVSDGRIGARRPNSVDLVVSGTLTNDETTLFVSGDLAGSLRGTPIQGISAGTGDGFGIVNGVAATNTVIAIEAVLPE